MREIQCRLLIVGAGPGGYVCAIRAGQLGLDTVIVDAEPPGGTCLNVGCIPSKALIHAADEFHRLSRLAASPAMGISVQPPRIDLTSTVAWKDAIVERLTGGVAALLRKARVRLVTGTASIRDGKTVQVETPEGPVRIRAEALVLATGSEPVELPALPFGGPVISSTQALALTEVPERLAVVGGGYIGLELGTAFAKLGSQVTVVEAAPRILPQYDAELTRPVAQRLQQLGIRLLTGARAGGLSDSGALRVAGADGAEEISADRVLVTVGRRPRATGAGIDGLRLDMAGPFIRIDDRCRSSMSGVYAIGDVTGEPMLAHRAMAQGEMVAEIVAGGRQLWDRRAIPAVCFTDPEIVSVGLSPEEAAAGPQPTTSAYFPFAANGRAMTADDDAGFVRVTARADTHEILGIQAVGAGVAEMSAGFALAIEMGARLEDIAGTIHAHPTRAEALHEACLRALGHALHI
ncbi:MULTISPECIES: dihydrolipoyl dehydrogenase [unclassified Paracoccus (in: a-proteobacteria)]|uniref:dihydrolipoyl dehydrogenase n=1 Tax=unclassified Paracoccus (in: a-proteobacteria) TaxID=2688777 RepID=UPI0012B428AC|nr:MULTISPECIES: dihydrolipoyl dehydrogenase [unclassified Paracoccus (in: a-proteobacteria)]UXU75081.1 dihydrolipoyl dehydrogenase [Paracoccus sp. SMMA_5]UXU80984.1 dihydrolipoyl dehydrogenase [Paracoccus sp. SMMA_5_TC]